MGALEDIFAKFGQDLPPADIISGELEEAMDTTFEEQRVEGEWLLYSCMHQKEGWDSYCIRRKYHDGNHIHKPWIWFLKKGLVDGRS